MNPIRESGSAEITTNIVRLSGSCVIDITKPRNSHQGLKSPAPSSEAAKEPTRSAQPSLSTLYPRFRAHHRQHQFAKPSSLGSANRPAATGKSETPKDLGPGGSSQIQTAAPVKTFQTSKDMVIERYRMTFPEIPELQGNANPPILATNLTNLSKRKREEPPKRRISIGEALEKGKGKAVIISEKSAKPATPAAPAKVTAPVELAAPTKVATSAGAARKFPSKPTPLNTPPPTKNSRHVYTNRPAVCEERVSSKKIERRGPAIKNAGRIFVSISSEDDDGEGDEGDEGDEDRVKGLEEKLREQEGKLRDQKGYTRKQMEKSVELEKKLIQSEKEKKAIEREKQQIQEKLEAATHLAASQQSTQSSVQSRQPKKLKRLVQLNRNDEPELNGQPFKLTSGDRVSEPKGGPSMKELYKDYKFTVNDPWGYPAPLELPVPDPNAFRTQSWQKAPYKFWDKAKLMSVHVHRQLTCDRGPIDIMTQPSFGGQSSRHSPNENSRSVSLNDEPDDDFRWPRGGRRSTFDAFMGIPENMVPAVKGANLGFRAGILVRSHILVLATFDSR